MLHVVSVLLSIFLDSAVDTFIICALFRSVGFTQTMICPVTLSRALVSVSCRQRSYTVYPRCTVDSPFSRQYHSWPFRTAISAFALVYEVCLDLL